MMLYIHGLLQGSARLPKTETLPGKVPYGRGPLVLLCPELTLSLFLVTN